MLLCVMHVMLAYVELCAALSDGDTVVMHAMLVLLGVHDAVCVLSSMRP